MLTKLRIKNFKAWGDELWAEGVPLAPITLLLGPNSAGKTSLLQSLLLLKQTFESPDRSLDLNLGGQPSDLVDVGDAEAVLYDQAKESVLGLGLGVAHEQGKISYEASFTHSRRALALSNLTLAQGEQAFQATRQSAGGYRLAAPGYAQEEAKRSYRPERAISFSAEAIAALGIAGAAAQDLSLSVRQAVTSLAYLGPLRGFPERTYLYSGVAPGDLGRNGERAAHALLASQNSRRRQRPGEEGGAEWLVQRVSAWLKALGIADELILERQGRSRHYEILVRYGQRRSNLVDVGFGISQVLPMLVLAHFVPQGTTLVAEQPELHLHPRAQGGLAELMVEVAERRGVQFIIETHSEHLFRRLQFLVADERIRAQDCALYFVERDEPSAKLTPLSVNQYGQIDNWPDHFFGDALGETERQVRRILERRRGERGGSGG